MTNGKGTPSPDRNARPGPDTQDTRKDSTRGPGTYRGQRRRLFVPGDDPTEWFEGRDTRTHLDCQDPTVIQVLTQTGEVERISVETFKVPSWTHNETLGDVPDRLRTLLEKR